MRITLLLKSAMLMVFLFLAGCDNNKASIPSEVGDILSVTITAPIEANVGDEVNLIATASGNVDISQVTFVWTDESSGDIGLVSSNNTAHFTAPPNIDMASIKVTATYNNSSASDSANITLVEPVIPPTLSVSITAPAEAIIGDEVNLFATASGENIDLSQVTFIWADESASDLGLTSSNDTANFIAPSNLDVASIKVTATYSEISASDSVDITLVEPVIPPTLNVSITAPDEVIIGDVVNLTATASGENIDISKVAFVWADESASDIGLASSNDTSHFIAPSNLEVASIKVTATYEEISASDSADVLVVDPIVSPVSIYNLSITGSTAAKENDTVIVNAIFTKDSIVDVSASLLWSQTGGPDVAFVEIEGELSFKAPIVTIDTELEFTVYTTDVDGNPLSKPWLITVAPSSINFTNTVSPNAKQVNPGDRVSLSSVAQTTGGGEITYQWQQINGTAVTLINETNKTAEFVAPNLAEVLVFKVTATDPVSGKSSTQTQKIKVNAPAIIAQQGVDHIVYNGH
ncbi:MAG: hypothetical protein P8I03_03335, partial [Thalassotalea sp.]|nr:hypothetical protein [Thalassotalea sp.]